jgi:mono/diheme cytochrome c family protein
MRYRWAVCGGTFLLAALSASLSADDKPKADAKDDALVKKGEYLVNKVGMCGNCHTPRNAKGELDLTKSLQGAPIGFAPKEKIKEWMDESPDLTKSGLIGDWGDDKMIKFLTTGLDPKGEKPNLPMPAYRLNADDARAVTAYIRSLPGEKK